MSKIKTISTRELMGKAKYAELEIKRLQDNFVAEYKIILNEIMKEGERMNDISGRKVHLYPTTNKDIAGFMKLFDVDRKTARKMCQIPRFCTIEELLEGRK